jgi:hypothetical protein
VFLLVSAGLLAAPEWRDPLALGREYPHWAVRQKKSVAAVFDIVVDSKGKVIRCQPVSIVGDRRLADTLCDRAKTKKLKPAVDAEGKPTYGLRRDVIKLFLHNDKQGAEIAALTQTPDLELSTTKLLDVQESIVDVNVIVAINESGKVADCRGDEDEAALIPYGEVACDQLEQVQLDRLAAADGSPINYVRQISVRFMPAG